MLAFTKRDILTPANALSLAGLVLTIVGSVRLDTLPGVFMVAFGRFLDIMDGHVARMTHTSEFGALVDAVFDKLALSAIVIAAAIHGLVFWPLLAWIALLNITNAILNSTAKLRGARTGSTLDGKYTMFLENISLALLLMAHFITASAPHNILMTAGVLAGLASVPLGIKAAYAYSKTTAKSLT